MVKFSFQIKYAVIKQGGEMWSYRKQSTLGCSAHQFIVGEQITSTAGEKTKVTG